MKTMFEILNNAGMESRQTKYGGYQAVYLHPSVSVAAACNLLEQGGYRIAVSYGSSWPILRDATTRYNAFGRKMI